MINQAARRCTARDEETTRISLDNCLRCEENYLLSGKSLQRRKSRATKGENDGSKLSSRSCLSQRRPLVQQCLINAGEQQDREMHARGDVHNLTEISFERNVATH